MIEKEVLSAENKLKVLFVSSGNSTTSFISPFILVQGESLKKIGIDISYFPVKGKGITSYFRSILELRRQVKENKYDIIHAHYSLSAWVSLLTFANIPVIVSLMGSDAYGGYIGEKKKSVQSYFLIFMTFLIQLFVKAIISKSQNIEKHVYRKKISHIIPNGVELDKFHPFDKNEARDLLGLSHERTYLLFANNTKDLNKNFSLCQESLKHLQDQDISLLTPFPVEHSKLVLYLNAADVMLFSSFSEGSPNIVKEAMACNCPVVSTDVGDVKWLFGEEKGYYLASYNASEFSQNIKLALEFAQKSGRTGGHQRLIDLGLDSAVVANKIADIYKSVIRKREE